MGKRGGSPVIVATSVAVVIGMALAVLWQWAESRSTIAADPTIAAPNDPSIALATPLLSARRAPGVLARRLNLDDFAAELDDVVADVDATSCLSVSVDGQPVVAHHASVPVVPASTMKLIVAAVALDVLGPGFQFTTSVNGVIGPEGIVEGDLTLLGGGDPLLSTEWWPTSGRQTEPPIHITRLEDLADQLVSAGVTRVAGRIVGDGSRYDDEHFAPSWGDDIKVVEAGPYDSLLVNDGRTSATSEEVTDDPALGAAEVFVALLRDRGVRVVGGAASATMPFAAEIASVTSVPLADVVEEMLQTSDDNTAEMLVKEIGLEVSGSGSRTSGIEAIMGRLVDWEVPIDGVLLVDGSGLSRDDRVPCQTIVGVLARGEPDDPLGAALPVASVSGTLADQFTGTPVEGRLQAKTGTLTDVKSLAGYLPVEGGGTIEFALVQNTTAVDQGAYLAVWNELADALVTYPEAVREDDLAPLEQAG
jgi:D-alanyl-D-alanine carboxypeptidase/D-alanyl-D-alanine-endopeptidase (penicillin-binding protein 4)